MYSSLEQVTSITILQKSLPAPRSGKGLWVLKASGEVLGTPKAGVTARSPSPLYFLPCVSCVVTDSQPVADWSCFLMCSGLKAESSRKNN